MNLGSLLDKLNYLKETKEGIKTWLQGLGFAITDDTPFRKYKDADNEASLIICNSNNSQLCGNMDIHL